MVSVTSGTWPLDNVGFVEETGYLQTLFNFSGYCLNTVKNKINILFFLVKLYNLCVPVCMYHCITNPQHLF